MLKTFLFFILLFLIFRFILSFAIARIKTVNNNFNTHGTHRKEGEITIENTNKQKAKKVSKNEGEYINYEEL